MNMKILKCLRNVNRFIDDDYQKLCVRYHNLELSHNRKKKALKRLLDYFTVEPDLTEFNEFGGSVTVRTGKYVSPDDTKAICKFISDALFCDGRQNCPSFVQRKKKKGGRQCAQD